MNEKHIDHSANPPVAIRRNPRVSSTYSVTWVLTNKCQNRCSYCPDELHAGKRDEYTVEEALSFLDKLIERYEKIHFSISGGEPTIAAHFVPMLERIRQANCTVGITSNGRRPVDFWKRVAPHLAYACVSYHPEFENNDEDFLERLAAIGEGTALCVRVMMVPERWQQCMDFIEKFKNSSIFGRLEIVRILDDFGGNHRIRPIEYSTEQEKVFLDSMPFSRSNPLLTPSLPLGADAIYADGQIEKMFDANSWVTRRQTNFKGWICNIGVESLFIRFNGDIFLANCAVGGKIGSIRDPEIRWPSVPVRCTDHLCHCGTDILVSKYKFIETDRLHHRIASKFGVEL